MSGKTFGDYSSYTERSGSLRSEDGEIRKRAEEDRASRIRKDAVRTMHEAPRTNAKAAEKNTEFVDTSLARNTITTPPKEANKLVIYLIDNSGSNRMIADALRNGAGYLHAMLSIVSNETTAAFQFFSDHVDGARLFQEADYTTPGEQGAKVLRASISRISGAGGGDEPEAIECALHRAAQYDFEHIAKKNRQLILVTDVVAHGMGMRDDDGCPHQGNWRRSLEEVHEMFGSFQVVASGDNREAFELQKQFIAPERRRFDLMDLATGRLTHEERCRLVGNAVLVLAARQAGRQAFEGFLMTLFEKWLAEPLYGSNTLSKAKEQINSFLAYSEGTPEEIERMRQRIFPST